MSTNDNQGDIRSAAESIYHSIHMYQQQQQYQQYNTMNRKCTLFNGTWNNWTIELIFFDFIFAERPAFNLDLVNMLTADYLAGFKQDGQMSVVRRFFCFFVIFDLFFISLLWLICIMVSLVPESCQ